MAVTNFPTNTEITNLQSTTYDVAGGQVTQASKQNGFITGVKQLITWLKSDSPQLTQESWINVSAFLNSWGNVLGGFPATQYRKNSLGNLELRGAVIGGTSGSIVFNLPVGYRPSAYSSFAVIANGTVIAELDILINGDVKIFGTYSTFVAFNVTAQTT
jgi:hypothetical protein